MFHSQEAAPDREGKTMAEIQNIMQLSYSAIQTYLPYTKVIYKLSEISQNAERINKYRSRKAAVDLLKEECTEENLWKCIVLFQEYLFLPVRVFLFNIH